IIINDFHPNDKCTIQERAIAIPAYTKIGIASANNTTSFVHSATLTTPYIQSIDTITPMIDIYEILGKLSGINSRKIKPAKQLRIKIIIPGIALNGRISYPAQFPKSEVKPNITNNNVHSCMFFSMRILLY